MLFLFLFIELTPFGLEMEEDNSSATSFVKVPAELNCYYNLWQIRVVSLHGNLRKFLYG